MDLLFFSPSHFAGRGSENNAKRDEGIRNKLINWISNIPLINVIIPGFEKSQFAVFPISVILIPVIPDRITMPMRLRNIKEAAASPKKINNCTQAGLVLKKAMDSYLRFLDCKFAGSNVLIEY